MDMIDGIDLPRPPRMRGASAMTVPDDRDTVARQLHFAALMMSMNQRCSRYLLIVVAIWTTSAVSSDIAFAQAADSSPDIEALRQQVDALSKQVAALAEHKAEPGDAATTPAPAVGASTAGSSLQFYGNLDISTDVSTKGIAGKLANDGMSKAVGNLGWMPAVSTNISYLGIRGRHSLGLGVAAIFQLETQLDIAATAGTVNTNSNNDSIVKGALTSRNSFVGISHHDLGALKLGKTDAPMKLSTARLNPFVGTIGDYAAVIGNTGGDNRTEFGTRLDHAVWYESPSFSGFSLVALWAPGQNRSEDNTIQAAGESSCAGGNVPGSGALPYGCNDGSFGTAFGVSASYEASRVYLTASYELHKDVNRTSDADGSMVTVGGHSYVFDGTVGIADEWGWRVGGQIKVLDRTTVGGLYEDLRRDLPYHYFDERSRKAFWLLVSQGLTESDQIHLGFAHASKSPGSLGEHNIETTPDADNSTSMFTGMVRHVVDAQVSFYVVYAVQANHGAAHYDLGAGGRAITTDCHDGSQIAAVNGADGSFTAGGPFCYTGGTVQGASAGMTYRF
jgi:predicted porin